MIQMRIRIVCHQRNWGDRSKEAAPMETKTHTPATAVNTTAFSRTITVGVRDFWDGGTICMFQCPGTVQRAGSGAPAH